MRLPAVAVVATTAVLVSLASTVSAAADPGGTNWDAIGACESGNNIHANTGNGFYGFLQFTLSTWKANGGTGSPASASRAAQIAVAERVKASQGIGAWPACGRHAGDSGGGPVAAVKAHAPVSAPRHAAPAAPDLPDTDPLTASKHAAPATPGPVTVTPSPVAKATVPSSTHVVAAGDTLAGIAAVEDVSDAEGEPGWQRIAEANKLADPDVIDVGQVLGMPGRAVRVDPTNILAPVISAMPGIAPLVPFAPMAMVTPIREAADKAPAKPVPASTVATGSAAHVVDLAAAQQGTPYVYGGAHPGAFDCSGLVQWAYRQVGLTLPRTAAQQSMAGHPVSRADLQPGDLLFYYSPVEHVAIYAGDGQIIEASQPGHPLKKRAVYWNGFVGARRIL